MPAKLQILEPADGFVRGGAQDKSLGFCLVGNGHHQGVIVLAIGCGGQPLEGHKMDLCGLQQSPEEPFFDVVVALPGGRGSGRIWGGFGLALLAIHDMVHSAEIG